MRIGQISVAECARDLAGGLAKGGSPDASRRRWRRWRAAGEAKRPTKLRLIKSGGGKAV
jgi:hypothetical protein